MRTLLTLPLALSACSALAPDPLKRSFSGDDPDQIITLGEIEERTRNFTDRYVQLLAEACDDVKRSATSAPVRREAHELKLRSASSAFDIVTSTHPIQEMLDLMVQLELQKRIWEDEGRAAKLFGDDGDRLTRAIGSARAEILSLAARVMKQKDIEKIRALMLDWRRRHPDVATGAFLRFGPYLEAPGGTLVAQLLTGFGIVNLSHLNPLDPAAKSVNRVSETADDVFYMAKRMPMLLEWQAEAAAYDLTAAVEDLASSSGRTLEQSRSLAESVTEALVALERITNPPKDPHRAAEPKGRPFDLLEAGATARELGSTTEKAREMLEELHRLVESPALSRLLSDVEGLSSRLLMRLFGEAALLLAVFFALRVAVRLLTHRLRRRDRPAPPPSGA